MHFIFKIWMVELSLLVRFLAEEGGRGFVWYAGTLALHYKV